MTARDPGVAICPPATLASEGPPPAFDVHTM